MKNYKMRSGILLFFLVALLLVFYGCKKPVEIQSKWLDKEIVIDAKDIDWQDYPLFYDEKTRSCIGVYNDGANLYLCFQNMDEDIQRQIIGQGLSIWFNNTGSKDKQLAVVYPIGGEPGWPGDPPDRPSPMQGSPTDRSSNMPGPPSGRSSGDQNMPQMKPFRHDSASKLRILTSEDDTGRTFYMLEAGNVGIHARFTVDQRNRLVYELKMPLIETNKTPYAAVASSANNIGIGFMTVESANRPRGGNMDRGGRPGGGMPEGGMPGGGMPGGGMPGGGMPGGGMPGGMGSRGESLEIWTNVTLASNPSNAQ